MLGQDPGEQWKVGCQDRLTGVLERRVIVPTAAMATRSPEPWPVNPEAVIEGKLFLRAWPGPAGARSLVFVGDMSPVLARTVRAAFDDRQYRNHTPLVPATASLLVPRGCYGWKSPGCPLPIAEL